MAPRSAAKAKVAAADDMLVEHTLGEVPIQYLPQPDDAFLVVPRNEDSIDFIQIAGLRD